MLSVRSLCALRALCGLCDVSQSLRKAASSLEPDLQGLFPLPALGLSQPQRAPDPMDFAVEDRCLRRCQRPGASQFVNLGDELLRELLLECHGIAHMRPVSIQHLECRAAEFIEPKEDRIHPLRESIFDASRKKTLREGQRSRR